MMISRNMRIFVAAMVVLGSVDAVARRERAKGVTDKDIAKDSKCPCTQKPKPKISRKLLITSVPKSGTHLLRSVLDELISPSWIHNQEGHAILSGNIVNQLVNDDKTLFSHVYADEQTVRTVEDNGLAVIFILRDPRDQVNSMANWVKNDPTKFADYGVYRTKSVNELIFDLIQLDDASVLYHFLRRNQQDQEVLRQVKGLNELYDLYTPWLNNPRVCTVRFEKLVGPKGGGTKEEQYAEIAKIAQYLGLSVDQNKIEQVANKAFGKGYSFHQGKIGSWHESFTEEHKDAFKQVAGQLLVDLGYEQDLNW